MRTKLQSLAQNQVPEVPAVQTTMDDNGEHVRLYGLVRHMSLRNPAFDSPIHKLQH